MRIGVIHWGFIPRGGGVEAHLLTVYPEMVRQGAEVFLLTEALEGFPEEETVKGIRVVRDEGLSFSKLDEREKKGEAIRESSKRLFSEFLDRYGIQAVQGHNLHMDFFDLSAALNQACQERNIPCFLIIHNQEFIDRGPQVMLRILKDLPWTKLVPISQFIAKDLQARIPDIPRDRYQVIMHGIDLDLFAPRSKKEKEKLKEKYGLKGARVILHPARMLRWKGIIPALKAMPEVFKRFPDARIVFTGRVSAIVKGEEEVRRFNLLVDRTIEELGIKENVLIGKYQFSDMPALFALSEAAIYTTILDEPFGLCPVEAMASGVPAVITRSGGLVESVIEDETGFIISRDEKKIPSELADRISRLFSDPALAERMGKAGRRRAEEKFDKSRMAKELITLGERSLPRAA